MLYSKDVWSECNSNFPVMTPKKSLMVMSVLSGVTSGLLKGIPTNLSPDLLFAIAEMGHGDEIVLGDANFPSR